MAASENRLIVITGGGGGIGRATALLCAKRGDRVAILDKNGESAKQAADAARAEGASGALGLACDVTDEAQVAQAFALSMSNSVRLTASSPTRASILAG